MGFLALLADLGYIGLHPEVVTGYKRRRGQDTLPAGKPHPSAETRLGQAQSVSDP